jgi:O-acetyl-ADP-ribose deacetylase (regulator of RNase III)
MHVPEEVPSGNCYRAMRAVLRIVDECDLGGDIFCPGLATGIGKVHPREAATEMFKAYYDWRSRRTSR